MILCIKTNDLRLEVISKYLSNTFDVIYDNKDKYIEDIDTVILPVQGITSKGYIHNTEIKFEEFISSIKPNKVFTGLIHNNIDDICSKCGINLISYLSEEVSYKNTLLSSEGLLKVLYDKGLSLSSKEVLITGYGRLTTNLANIFNALNSNITIYARQEKDRVSAKLNNYNSINSLESKDLYKYDIIINTIPHIIFTNSNVNYFNEKAIFIDIASTPGGYDESYKNVIVELGIPGRIFPTESGLKIAKYIGDKL